jgi:hypothetical protein
MSEIEIEKGESQNDKNNVVSFKQKEPKPSNAEKKRKVQMPRLRTLLP